MEMNWSRWFRCESSFGLLLVPSQPGIFALAEEVAQTVRTQQRRMLAVFEVAEADDLSRAMSRLFAAGSQWREKMAEARVYVRYAIAPSIADRKAAATALKNWLSAQREVASQIFEKVPTTAAEPAVAVSTGGTGEMRPERRASRAQHEGAFEMKTVAERAVDRVTHGVKLGKAVLAES
jgi:acyl-CoA reductase-like NAD-dependent aldehyde dehydrogenase